MIDGLQAREILEKQIEDNLSTDTESLQKVIDYLEFAHKRWYEAQEELERAWCFTRGVMIKDPNYGWPVGEYSGIYGLMADEIIEALNE